ncbi:MAG: sugar phosphate isomerase/epimerase [Candidatus Omnitrophota bacterium]
MSFHPISYHAAAWGDEWEKALDDISIAGYQGVEDLTCLYANFFDRSEIALRHLTQWRLVLSALWIQGDAVIEEKREEIHRETLRRAEFLQKMGSHVLVFDISSREIAESERKDFQTAAFALNEIGKRCQDYDVNLCVLTRCDSRLSSEEEIDRLMNLVQENAFFLCPDAGHLHCAGEDPVRILKTYGACVRHLVFRDVKPEAAKGEPPFCELGEGTLDFREIMHSLKGISYQGGIAFVLDESSYSPKESAEISYNYYKEILAGES